MYFLINYAYVILHIPIMNYEEMLQKRAKDEAEKLGRVLYSTQTLLSRMKTSEKKPGHKSVLMALYFLDRALAASALDGDESTRRIYMYQHISEAVMELRKGFGNELTRFVDDSSD